MKNTKSDFDLIIIGAGINGAGIARDAAMRGLKVLLVDKGDIGGGTSAWSTRLIHGGLRYLEYGEFGLVRESLRERETLMNIAPHLVRPLPILIPVYKNARRGRLKIRLGMFVYDLLSIGKSMPLHSMLSRQDVIEKIPALERERLEGAAVYYDAQVRFAERLVLENVLSAFEHGARVLTYTKVTELTTRDGCVTGVTYKDQFNCEVQTAEAKAIVNAAGPWIDQVTGNDGGRSRLIGGTRGSHIIVPPFPGAPEAAIYVEAANDGRPFFVIPWNRKYLIGTTDIRYDGDPDLAEITDEEIDYLLGETNRVLPAANLGRKDILFTYSGVRPLPFTTDKREAAITRRHFIRQDARLENLFSIVGGKLTTYRSLSEETVNLIERKLGLRPQACRTANEPLPGFSFDNFEAWLSEVKRLESQDPRVARRLGPLYGSLATRIADLIKDNPNLAERIDPETGAIAAEVVYSFRHEFARTLADCLLRRTMVGLNSRCGLNAVESAAYVGRQHLGWSEERVAREIIDYRNEVERLLQHSSS